MKSLFNLFKSKKRPVTVVSGLPRSGTSMMMKMLEAGGIPPITDNIRAADGDNPKGYYEFERVKKMKEGDVEWVSDAQGKAVKVISALLEYLPPDFEYRVLFMRRAMPEVLASQKKMLVNREEDPDKISDEEMTMLYEKHLAKVTAWLRERDNFSVLYVNYNELLKNPAQHIPKINAFLGNELDAGKMAGVIDPGLYRQRKKT